MKRNHNYKGGTITQHGYRLQYVGKDHHLADIRGYAYEHRVEAEKKIGRQLAPGEMVRHVDGDNLNNAHDNIEVVHDMAELHFLHRKTDSQLRRPGEPNSSIGCACSCGGRFLRFDGQGRPRRCITGHNLQRGKKA